MVGGKNDRKVGLQANEDTHRDSMRTKRAFGVRLLIHTKERIIIFGNQY